MTPKKKEFKKKVDSQVLEQGRWREGSQPENPAKIINSWCTN